MSSELNYISYGKKTDGTNYCSGLETFADNLIEENERDAVITFPSKNGWASLRSSEYRMTTDNAEVILPYPIYKLTKVIVNIPVLTVSYKAGTPSQLLNQNVSDHIIFQNNLTGETVRVTSIDITPLVVTEEEWKALPLATGRQDYAQNVRKDNTFVYSKGGDTIKFSGNVHRIGSSILGGIFADNTPVYERLILHALNQFYSGAYVYGKDGSTGETVKYVLGYLASENMGVIANISNVMEWTVQVEYIPVTTSTKIRARKSAKTTVDFFQPFNQRAEVIDVGAFGKNMATTAQKTGIQELTVVKRYTKLADIPPVGARVTHNGRTYRIASNSYSITNTTYIQVTHSLSENWTMKSNHVAVDQKFRNWAIPQETLWRTLYDEEYLHIGVEPVEGRSSGTIRVTDVMAVFDEERGITATSVKPISQMFWSSDGINVVVPASTYGIAGSMLFTASFKDSLSVGLKSIGGNTCEDVYYCDENGELNEATIILANGIANQNAALYPECNNTYNTANVAKYEKTFSVLKDAGEALKFTFQLSVIADDSRIIIGDKFTEMHTLVKKWTEGELVTFTSESFISSGSERVQGASLLDREHSVGTSGALYCHKSLTGMKSWGVCTKEGDIIVACNDTTITTLYFTVSKDK